jgi:hypothetical protein
MIKKMILYLSLKCALSPALAEDPFYRLPIAEY